MGERQHKHQGERQRLSTWQSSDGTRDARYLADGREKEDDGAMGESLGLRLSIAFECRAFR